MKKAPAGTGASVLDGKSEETWHIAMTFFHFALPFKYNTLKEVMQMCDITKKIYQAVKEQLERKEYKLISISRTLINRYAWRLVYADVSGCPFTPDWCYLIEVFAGEIKIRRTSYKYLSLYERAKFPAKNLELMKLMEEKVA